MIASKDLSKLRLLIKQHVDIDELQELTFDLGVDWDDLGGENKKTIKIISLLTYLANRVELDRLIALLEKGRPDVKWGEAFQSNDQANVRSINLTFSRPKNYVGRDHEIEQIKTWLKLDTPCWITVYGFGGSGKTALVSKCLHQLHNEENLKNYFPDGVIFHDFYKEESEQSFYMSILGSLGIKPDSKITKLQCHDAIVGKRILFFLDGLERAQQIFSSIKDLIINSSVITTTQKAPQSVNVDQEIKLDYLAPQDAHALLEKFAGKFIKDNAHTKEICEALGNIAIAVMLAGKYMKFGQFSSEKYLEELEANPLKVLTDRNNDSKHGDLKRLILRSVEMLSEECHMLLALLGCIALAPIKSQKALEILGWDSDQLENASRGLIDIGLLDRIDDDSIKLNHSLFHEFGKEKADEDMQISFFERMGEKFSHLIDKSEKKGLEGIEELFEMRGHALHLLEILCQQELYQLVLVLCERLGLFLQLQGFWQNLIDISNLCIDIYAALNIPEGVVTWTRRLGVIFNHLGLYDVAVEKFDRALSISVEIQDQKNERLNLRSIGDIYMNNGDLELALKYFSESLNLAREINDNKGEGACLGSLADLYQRQGSFDLATTHFKQAISISQEYEDRFGEEANIFNFGYLLYEQGKYDKALEKIDKSINIARGNFDRVSVLIGYNLRGRIYAEKENFEEGLENCFQAHESAREIHLGPHTGIAKVYMGWILSKIGNHAQGTDLIKKGIQMLEDYFNLELYLQAHNDLAEAYLLKGDFKLALSITKQTIQESKSKGLIPILSRALFLAGQANLGFGQHQEAQDSLCEAQAYFEQMDSKYLPKLIEVMKTLNTPDAEFF